jgi:uncharacterized protein YyaL (SSP411 family)
MSGFHFSPRPNRAGEIQWRAWGEAPFAEARAANKPVLLAISAVWCHWCHVMDETTYSAQDVIDAINHRFIPVRVDNDQRPDVNARYNQGGWPTTAILTPDGDLLKGATYVPPEQMHHLLTQIDAFYADAANRRAVAEHLREVQSRRTAAPSPSPAAALKRDVADRVFSFLDSNFDERFGGFGSDQKFPQTNALQFLLDRYARTRDERTREMAQRTLHAMAGGGMYDHVHGGFYRYSTTRDFSVPHFEKMLEDLGGLLLACARASALFSDPKIGDVALDVRSYLDAHLWIDRFGAYGGSQDADEKYYELDAAGRAGLPEPYVDPTIYTSWNAQTAHALIVAGPLLEARGADGREWAARGLFVLESLWGKLSDDGLMCRFYDGAAHVRGLLADQAWSSWAALAAFEATGEIVWLRRAESLTAVANLLFDEGAAAYADRPHGEREPGRLTDRSFPLDENALMARVLLKLAALTGDTASSGRAQKILDANAESYRGYGMFASAYGSAVLDWFAPPLDIKVVGSTDDGRTASLRDAARRQAAPPVTVDTIDPVNDARRLALLGQTAAENPLAMVCSGRECFARTSDPRELESALSQASLAR